MKRYRNIVVSAFGFLVAGCQPSGGPADLPPSSTATAQQPAGAPLFADREQDLALVARNAVLGFRSEAGALRAGYATHDAVIRDGIIELTPYHYLAGQRTVGGAMDLETGAVLRADGTQVGGAGNASLSTTGTVEINRGEVVEEISNREDGIEQAWRFDAEPQGAGDITVEVSVTNQKYVSTTDTGLHFKSDAGLGFRYSTAQWIDATGETTAISTQFEDGYITMTIPEELLASSSYPARLDPSATAEVAVDNPVTGGFNGANSIQPAIGFDGTNYLVVWSDDRLGIDKDIFGARVSQAGAVLDASGIDIASTAGDQSNPTVTFANGQFVVAWEDFKVANGTDADIVAATVSSTGVVASLGSIAHTATSETEPQLAGSAAGALLVWNANGDILGAAYNGTSFGTPISIAAQSGVSETDPAVAANPAGNYLVAWSEGTTATADLEGIFVTPAGALSGAKFAISAGAGRQFQPVATFDGTNYGLAWTTNNSGNKIFAGRVSTAGTVLDTHTEGALQVGGVQITAVANTQPGTGLACVTGSCIVSWQRRNAQGFGDVFAQLVTTTATPLTLSGAELTVSAAPNTQSGPAIVSTGTSYFEVWNDLRDVSPTTVMGSRITSAGSVTDTNGILIPLAANNRESAPAVGISGTTHAVIWTDSRSFANDIELVRFKSTTKVDASALVVSNGPNTQNEPRITQAVTGPYLAVWADSRNGIDRDIYGARLDATGTPLDAGGLAINTSAKDQLTPAAATDGTNFLVVWEDRRSGNFDIYAALVSSTGTVTTNDIVVCNQTGDQLTPSVAYDKTNLQYVVVWTDERVSTDPNIYGARIDATGHVLDPNGVVVSNAAGGQFTPSIAFAAGKYLAVWEDRRTDSQGDIFGARLTGGAALTVVDPAGISIGTTTGEQFEPVVANIGAASGSYIVAWTDGRALATNGTDIYAEQVGVSQGTPGTEFLVAGSTANESAPALGDSNSAGTTRIAYVKVRTDLQTTRVETRQLKTSGDLGEPCGGAGSCQSGFCVDGKCCESACSGGTVDCQSCAGSKTGQADGLCRPEKVGTNCRPSVSAICDIAEFCDGTSTVCPPDLGKNPGKVCNTVTLTVCPVAGIAGAPHKCP